ncbi:MAG: LysM peptidoglycan-binding domain-containing protein [Vicinamibacterales bacterium]
MGLRDTYNAAIQTAKSLHMEGAAEERDGKLYFHGTVRNQDEANRIWDAIKTVPTWRTDIIADIRPLQATSAAAPAAASQPAPEPRTYTVKRGDTLGKIARELLGDAGAYPRIFEANRDQLSDPDRITPGQVLRIPDRG